MNEYEHLSGFDSILQHVLLKNDVPQEKTDQIILDLHVSLEGTGWLIDHEDWLDSG